MQERKSEANPPQQPQRPPQGAIQLDLLAFLQMLQSNEEEKRMKQRLEQLDAYRKNNLDVRSIVYSVQKEVDNFIKKITNTQTPQEAKMLLNAYNPPSGKCDKVLQGERQWICYTCVNQENPLKDDIITVYCTDCIKNGNHQGHQIKMIPRGSGFCDCGNEQLLLKSGFCKNHGGSSYDSLNLDEFIPDCKQTIFQNIEKSIRKIDLICIQFDAPDFEKVRLQPSTLNLYKVLVFHIKFLNLLAQSNGYCAAKMIQQLKKVSSTSDKVLHHYRKPPLGQGEESKKFQCQKHIYDSYYSLLEEQNQEEEKQYINFEEFEKNKRCRCIRLNNIMRCFKNLQFQAQAQLNKLFKKLCQSTKFGKLFRICYFSNIKDALLTPKFFEKQKDLFDNIG